MDRLQHKNTWDSGEGAFLGGGRWNTKNVRAVYCALDAATAILEVTVHNGFDDLDSVPRIMTKLSLLEASSIYVLRSDDVPNPNWLVPANPTPNQQQFGNDLLAKHGAFYVQSVVSKHSWNLVFLAGEFGEYSLVSQEKFALDPRFVVSI
ncbi:RES domain-containing protein [Hwanghaeella grinnelliae]|uniref:RES domain-containing protein n=2 Tax=Hwanghaeella grinnelliae TaxID=2500179 RepID=A0A437QI88_9PROT|nr:RES domain-containing protein [Hwanghaeella grinnelliae]